MTFRPRTLLPSLGRAIGDPATPAAVTIRARPLIPCVQAICIDAGRRRAGELSRGGGLVLDVQAVGSIGFGTVRRDEQPSLPPAWRSWANGTSAPIASSRRWRQPTSCRSGTRDPVSMPSSGRDAQRLPEPPTEGAGKVRAKGSSDGMGAYRDTIPADLPGDGWRRRCFRSRGGRTRTVNAQDAVNLVRCANPAGALPHPSMAAHTGCP